MSKLMRIFFAVLAVTVLTGASLFVFDQPDRVYAASEFGRGGPGGFGQPATGEPMTNPQQDNMLGGYGRGNIAGGAMMNTIPVTPLSEAEAKGLQEAILEEYGAMNLYNAIAEQLGVQVPFSQIARSESQHVNVLIRLAERYGVEVPENPGLASAPQFASAVDACAAGVTAEIADADLYDQLLPDVTHPDLQRVYTNLKNASLQSHLPAFEACN